MRKTLIASVVAAVAIDIKSYDLDDPKLIIKDPHQGKRGKKGKAKKDWQR